MQIKVRYGSDGERPSYRGELRSGACVKWQGPARSRKEAALQDASGELDRRAMDAMPGYGDALAVMAEQRSIG